MYLCPSIILSVPRDQIVQRAYTVLSTFHYYSWITGWTLVYNVPEAFPCKHSDIIYCVIGLLVSLLNVGVSFSLC